MSKIVKKPRKVKGELDDLINKYLNAKEPEKKLLLLIIKRKKPDFKE